MALKKLNSEKKEEIFNYVEQQKQVEASLSSVSNSVIDSLEKDNVVDLLNKKEAKVEFENNDKGPAFPDPEERKDNELGHTLHPREFYDNLEGFTPAIEVSQKRDKIEEKVTNKKLTKKLGNNDFRKLTEDKKVEVINEELAKPATEQDLSNLDESIIMNLPQIKANSFQIIGMLNPKPKDKSIRFKWANCKNDVAGNLGRYLALGFQIASIDDVDQKQTPIDPSMIEGSQVKYYDVILLKVNILKLMELYKSNIVRSVMKLGRVREKGMAEARREFSASVAEVPGANAAYNKVKSMLGGKEPVEFYTPGMDESEILAKNNS